MTDDNPKRTPERGVSHASDDSGYYSILPSPAGMFHVSSSFRGTCKKKVHENFGYIKVKVYPIAAIEEIQATHDDFLTEQSLEELKDSKRLKQADKLIKQVIRKGEAYCKTFLESFQSDSIQSAFVLYHLLQQNDKIIPPNTNFNVDIKDILHDSRSRICEELENDRVLDPLLEFYILSLDDHDRVVYNCKTRLERNNCVLDILSSKESGDWIPGFLFVLESNGHSRLIEDIQHPGQRIISVFPYRYIFDSTFEMSIRVNGINSYRIELELARHSEIDNLCRQFAKLEISNIRRGSVLLMVHPIVPDVWNRSTENEKEALLQDFIRELMDKPDIKDLIKGELTVTFDIREIKNVFGDPVWRVKKETSSSPDKQCLEDNWTYLTEELEVNRLMEQLEMKNLMEKGEKDKISIQEGRRERANEFLRWYSNKLPFLPIATLIKCLEATGQVRVTERLKTRRLCPECLIETYKHPSNYSIILDEMNSTIMKHTVGNFKEVPHHIKNILTPACGKSRRDRAQLFMQYVFVNEDVLRSFENTLCSMDFISLDPKQCINCQPKSASLDLSSGLVEEEGDIKCVLNVTKERDRSLRIELLKSTKALTKSEKVVKRPKLGPASSREYYSTPQTSLEPTVEDPLGAIKIKEKPPLSRLSSESYVRTEKDFSPTVVAIDFGTTYSGFAFSLKKENSEIYTKKWNNPSGKGRESDKTPTTILLDANKEFKAFGYEAEDEYEELCNSNRHNKYYYFRHFKMRLHTAKSLTRSTVIEDVLGKTMPALEVFSLAIRYLKGEAEKALTQHGFSKDNTSWVITVPAIWDDSAKQFMREATEQAFIPTRRLTIALEPEVASVYIGSQTMEKTNDSSGAKSSLGSKFMVVDVGGGTADLTVMETAKDYKLKQISIASGGPCGGECINNQILAKIISLVGADIMDLFRQTCTCDYNQLISEVEFAKRSWSKDKELKLKIPESLIECFESKVRKTFSTQIDTCKGVFLKKKDRLVFSKDEAAQMINSVIDKIIEHAKESLHKFQEISHIVIVGGFAENDVMKAEFVKQFPGTKVIIPPQAGLAVLKGAVLFGHDPSCVYMRRCDRTYGTQVYRAFLEGSDHAEKLVVDKGTRYCKDVFNRLAKIGESVEIDETRKVEIEPLWSGMTAMSVKLYGSTDPDPKYVTDESCTYLGKIIVDIPEDCRNTDETILVSMTFGQTEIVVEGQSEHGKNVVKTKIDFLKE